jgi:outer membrane protein TolC
MKNVSHIIFIIFLLVGLVPYYVSALQPLTLEECISLALKNNEFLKASLSDVEIHKQDTRISYSELLPKLSSKIQYTLFDREPSFIIEKDAFSTGVPPSNVSLPAGEEDVYAFTLSIEQPVFTGGYLTNTYENTKVLEKASEMNSKRAEEEVILKVKLSYYDLLKTFKIKETQEKVLNHKEERRRVVEELQKEGLSNKEELLLVKTDIATQKLELFKTENDLNLKEKTLKDLIGIEHDVEITLADRLENKKLLIELTESKDIALKTRKDLSGFHYLIKSAEKEIEIAESDFYPRSSVIGSYTRQKETPLSNPDLWALMFTLDWNIFEWGKTKADVRRAKAKYEKLTAEYDSLKKDVMLDVDRKWFKVKEAEKEVKVVEDKFLHAEEHYKNTSLKYRENIIKTAEILEAETYLIESRNRYINSIYDLNKALAEFEFSISSDITPFIVTETTQPPRVEITNARKEQNLLSPVQAQTHNVEEKKLLEVRSKVDKGYLIQIGAFKYSKNAQDLLEILKVYYPDVFVVVADGFNKVRIPGIKSKEEAALIIKDIEKKFKLKPFLLMAH